MVVGNDPAFDFHRLRIAARAVASGARFFAVNMDARFPVGEGTFDPGCGALVEAVAVASGVRPFVIGKPHPPLFARTIERLGCRAGEAAMVGDNLPSDIVGGRAAGMRTVWLNAHGHESVPPEVDLRVAGLPELHRLWRGRNGGEWRPRQPPVRERSAAPREWRKVAGPPMIEMKRACPARWVCSLGRRQLSPLG